MSYRARSFEAQTYGAHGRAVYGAGTVQQVVRVPAGRMGGIPTARAAAYGRMGACNNQAINNVASGLSAGAGVALATTGPAGPFVAGGLLVGALALKLVGVFRKCGKREALAYAKAQGWDEDFAKEYVKLSTRKLNRVQNSLQSNRKKVGKERADLAKMKRKGKSGKKIAKQKDRLAKAIDKLNASKAVVNLMVGAPEEPMVANQRNTIPAVVEQQGPIAEFFAGDGGKAVAIGGAVLGVGLLGAAAFRATR